ncbi:MAG: chromosomal replication initiator protein DnaA [Christensenellaceae bacterium]|jgi:chromosomal replication initiator protein|nr:chromosomal replication initiator protein DnaA [Christensenellaceae bacterium]
MQDLKPKWNAVLNKIESEVTAVSFDLWIKTLEPIDIVDGKLIIMSPTTGAKNQLLKLHSEKLKTAIEAVFENITEFVVLDPAEKNEFFQNKEVIRNTEETVSIKEPILPKNALNEKYSFDSFVVGKSNQFVYAAARSVAEEPGLKYNPLFIYGGVGLGKTHLLHAIGNFMKHNSSNLKVLYTTCENFTNDYISSLRSSKDSSNSLFRGKYRNVDVLMVDDIQFISRAERTQEEFFHTFNDLYQNNKQIIICSDRHPKDIATLQDRMVSRFTSGLIQDIQQPDYETRLAILQKKVQIEKFNVNNNVLEFIAKNIDSNIRELEGVLSKVIFYAGLLGKKEATIEEAKEALKEHITTTKEKITADGIMERVCKYYNVSRTDMVGKKKNKEIVDPRQVCIYLICTLLEDLPLAAIGNMFGGRDHTTIIHARDKIAGGIKSNYTLSTTISDLIAMIKTEN